MAITRVTQISAQTNNATLPATPNANDLIIVFAHRDGSNTAPGLVSGFTNLYSTTGANTNSHRVAYKLANGTEGSIGPSTNATSISIMVFRGNYTLGTPIGANTSGGASSNTITYNGITLQVQDTTSWVVGFAAHRTATNVGQAPNGMTLETSKTDIAGSDTEGPVNTWNSSGVTVNATSGWRSHVLEVLSMHSVSQLPSPQSLTLSTVTPTIAATLGEEIDTDYWNVAFTSSLPSANIQTTPIALTLGLVTPTVAAVRIVSLTTTPIALSLALTTPAWGIGNITTAPTLTFTQLSPTIAAQRIVSLTTTPLSLSFAVVSPTITAQKTISLTTTPQSLTFAQATPVWNIGINPSAQALSFTLVVPTRGIGIAPGVLSLSFNQPSVTVAALQTVSLATTAIALTFGLISPVVSSSGNPSASITTTAQELTFALVTPTVEAIAIVSASIATTPITLTLGLASPTVSTSNIVSLSTIPLSLSFVAVSPNVVAKRNVSIATTPIALTLDLKGGSTLVGANLNPLALTLALISPTPSVQRTSLIATTPISLILTQPSIIPQGLKITRWLRLSRRHLYARYNLGASLSLTQKDRIVKYNTVSSIHLVREVEHSKMNDYTESNMLFIERSKIRAEIQFDRKVTRRKTEITAKVLPKNKLIVQRSDYVLTK